MKFLKVIYVIKSVYCNVLYNYRFFLYMIKKKIWINGGLKVFMVYVYKYFIDIDYVWDWFLFVNNDFVLDFLLFLLNGSVFFLMFIFVICGFLFVKGMIVKVRLGFILDFGFLELLERKFWGLKLL